VSFVNDDFKYGIISQNGVLSGVGFTLHKDFKRYDGKYVNGLFEGQAYLPDYYGGYTNGSREGMGMTVTKYGCKFQGNY
jgi:hypothetical protein